MPSPSNVYTRLCKQKWSSTQPQILVWFQVALIATPDRICFCRKTYTSHEISHRKNNFGELNWWNKYLLFVGWQVRIVENYTAFSSPRSQLFTLLTNRRPANNMFIFFSAVNWFYRSQMGLLRFAYATLLLNQLARRLLTTGEISSQWASNSDTRQRCIKEEIFFDLRYDSCIYFTIYFS